MKCQNVNCKYFLQEVPPDHQHTCLCKDTTCRRFNEWVPPDHIHEKAGG